MDKTNGNIETLLFQKDHFYIRHKLFQNVAYFKKLYAFWKTLKMCVIRLTMWSIYPPVTIDSRQPNHLLFIRHMQKHENKTIHTIKIQL